ncbi:MAG: nucleoside triphosphate pyrophosphohydrolase [Calditrichia bacterium]|nr:nucleoside triphosphate pyrophosphohydrolase [Calditrichia bacterium]
MTARDEFQKLIEIMYRLRQECPWDKKQTHESLRESILEEAFEAVEAIDEKNWNELKSELGDLLLQIVFQGVIAEENGIFNIEEIVQSINSKLVERHPHVFSDKNVNSAKEVEKNWEQIKLQKENRNSILQGVPKQLSALLRAQKVQQKAEKVGFDWHKIDDVIDKIEEELAEFKQSVKNNDPEAMEEEIGDFLFSIVNLARWKGINSENALRTTTNKFISRFQYIERQLVKQNRTLEQSTLKELDVLWEEAKRKMKNGNS